MKKYFLSAIIFCSMIAFAGCTVEYVNSQLSDVEDVRGVAPRPDYIWIGGDWVWSGSVYAWHAGQWARGRAGKAWTRGHWEHGAWGYRWHRSNW
jgi:hypothetical protein